MSATTCPCGSGKAYADCCAPYHEGKAAPTAEATMRARYSAFALAKIDYLQETLPARERKAFDRKGVSDWATGSEWKRLEIQRVEKGQPGDDRGVVEFTAHFVNGGHEVAHHEESIFQFDKSEGRWVLAKSITNKPAVRADLPGRNDPCHCGSGKKFKKCHGLAA